VLLKVNEQCAVGRIASQSFYGRLEGAGSSNGWRTALRGTDGVGYGAVRECVERAVGERRDERTEGRGVVLLPESWATSRNQAPGSAVGRWPDADADMFENAGIRGDTEPRWVIDLDPAVRPRSDGPSDDEYVGAAPGELRRLMCWKDGDDR
jgi:hypothetical protein